jgi:hypothetical protein
VTQTRVALAGGQEEAKSLFWVAIQQHVDLQQLIRSTHETEPKKLDAFYHGERKERGGMVGSRLGKFGEAVLAECEIHVLVIEHVSVHTCVNT